MKRAHEINKNDYFTADVRCAQNYYPFGMMMPGRSYNAGNYRFGFNGKEKDDEVKGTGNQIDYGMRAYDPRVGRFMSVDPLTKKFPDLTPYQFASNTPIQAIDLDGLEALFIAVDPVISISSTFDVPTAATIMESLAKPIDLTLPRAPGEIILAPPTTNPAPESIYPNTKNTETNTETPGADWNPPMDLPKEGVDVNQGAEAKAKPYYEVRGKNRLPDKGTPNTTQTNKPGTTTKKYGPDGNVQKEFNKGHKGKNVPKNERDDHVHDYKPAPKNQTGKGERMPGRKPKEGELNEDFGK